MKLIEKVLLVLLGAFMGLCAVQAQIYFSPESFTSPQQKQFNEDVGVILQHNEKFQGKVGMQFKYNLHTLQYLIEEVDRLKRIYNTEI